MSKKNLGKKAESYFIPIVSLAAIGALIFFLINFTASIEGTDESPIGTYASAVYLTSHEAEKALLYLDGSAKSALDRAILSLGEKGGGEEKKCGEYLFTLWNNQSTTCFPDYDDALKNEFGKELFSYLSTNPHAAVFPIYQYKVFSADGKITIKASTKDFLSLPVSLDYKDQERLKVKEKEFSCKPYLEEISPEIDCIADKCILNPEAEALLEKTSASLERQGYILRIVQAYKTLEEQKALYETCQDLDCEKEVEEPSCSEPFVTGGAISIQLLKKDTGELLGTGEQGIGKSYDNYYFTDAQKTEQEKIGWLMCDDGWVRKGNSERTKGNWWQFEYKTERWNAAKQKEQKTGQAVCSVE